MMDRNCIEGPGLNGVRTGLLLATYAVLLCIVPLVVCRPDTEVTSFEPWRAAHTEILSDQNTHPLAHHKKKHHKINRIDEDPSNSFKQWGERKKKIRSRSKPVKSKFSEDYDEMAEKRITKEANIINNLKYLESDKKYFDYFPIEDVELNYDPKEDNIRVVVLSSSDDDDDIKKMKSKKFARSMKKQRSKRDTAIRTDDGSSIIKRNAWDTYIHDFIESQRGNNIRRGCSNIRGQTLNYQGSSNIADGYPSQHTRNDPWDNRFTSALNNLFVPIPQPVYPSSPVFVKYPIPGIYYNPISPPRGYLPPIKRPIMPPSIPTIGERIGTDDQDDRVIWDVIDYVPRPASNQPSGQDARPSSPRKPASPPATRKPTSPPATRKPAPPLIHRPTGNSNMRPTISAPSPSDDFAPPASNVVGDGIENSFNTRPTQEPQRRQKPAISTSPRNFQQSVEPSKCVWAIVTCCSRNNLAIRYACFEQVGCHGAFWDYNPCADKTQDAALNEATRFFD